MKKFLLVFLFGLLLVVPGTTIAIDLGQDLAKSAAVDTAGYAAATETSFAELIGSVIQGLLSFVGVIFMVLMVYAGYLWMTARGDETQIEKAQDIIRSSIIGLVITVGAFSITTFVVPRILERTTGDSGSPSSDEDGGSEICCTVCPAHGNGDCTKETVASEEQCMQKYGCPNNGTNNVENDCNVTVVGAGQCVAGNIERVNCCSVTDPAGTTIKSPVADSDACDAICDDREGDGLGLDVENNWSCDFEVTDAASCQ